MEKHRRILLFFALTSFYFLSTDVLLNAKTAELLGHGWAEPVNSVGTLCLGLGFMLFSVLYNARKSDAGRRRLFPAVAAVSVLCLLGFLLSENHVLFFVLAAAHMTATGMVGGAAFYMAAVELREQRFTGKVIGLAIGLEALMQALVLGGINHPLVRAAILIVTLAAAAALSVKWPHPQPEKLTAQTEPEASLPRSYLLALASIVALISLMGGLNDGFLTSHAPELPMSLYALPRVFYLLGAVAAGFLADVRNRRYLPIVTLTVMLLSTVGVLFLRQSSTYVLNMCVYSLFAGFAVIYLTVPFLDIAPRMKNPALWASMGRIAKCGFLAVGALCSTLFFSLPFDAVIACYVVLSILLLFLFLYAARQQQDDSLIAALAGFKKRQEAESPAAPELAAPAQNEDWAQPLDLLEDEHRVVQLLCDGLTRTEIAERLELSTSKVAAHLRNIRAKLDSKHPLGFSPEVVRLAGQYGLTGRETEVLNELMLGRSNAEIAANLHIEETTVKTHVGRVLKKVGAGNRSELLSILRA